MPQLQLAEAELEQVEARDVPGLLHDGVEPTLPHRPLFGATHLEGYCGIHHHDEIGSVLDGEIGVARMAHVTVDIVPSRDPVWLEESRDGRGGRDGVGDRHVAERPLAEDNALSPVEIDGGDEQRARKLVKVIAEALPRKCPPHKIFQWGQGEESRRHVTAAPGQDIGPVEGEAAHGALAHGPEKISEVPRRYAEGALVINGAAVEVQRVIALLFEDLVEVMRPDALSHEGGDHGAGAGADVEVEGVAAKARQQFIARRQRAHLVHAADHSAPGQDQRPERRLSPPR